MRGILLLLGAISSALWITAGAGQSDSGSAQSVSRSEDEVKTFLRRYVKEAAIDASTTRYFDAFVDLDSDGKKEVIIHLVGGSWCGTGGCPTLILTSDGSSYRLVTAILATRAPIRVLPVKSHGWCNLAVVAQGGSVRPAYEAELSFDGHGYPTSPGRVPANPVGAKPKGDVILPSEANLFAKGKSLYP